LAGTVFMLVGVVGYGLSVVNLIPLLLLAVLHVVIPWVLIVFAVLALPRANPKPANPFMAGAGAAEGTDVPRPPNAQV